MNISDSSVSELRVILNKHYKRKFTQEQARRYGKWLLNFYSHLAENSGGTGKGPNGNSKSSASTVTQDIK